MDSTKNYVSPLCQAIEVSNEAVLCVSSPDYGNAGSTDFTTK